MAKIGLNAELSYGTVGSASVTYAAMCNVRDVTLNLERGEADISTRCSDIELVVSTMQKISLEFEMIWDEDDADFANVLSHYTANTVIYLQCLSSDDGSGVAGPWVITKLNRKEGLRDAVIAEVAVKPTQDGTTYPDWVDAT